MANIVPAGYESSQSGDEYNDDGFYYEKPKAEPKFVHPLVIKKQKLVGLLRDGNLSGIKEELDTKNNTLEAFDIDQPLTGHWNMLYEACFIANLSIVEYLIEDRGACVDMTDNSETPLMIACSSTESTDKVLPIVKLLIKASTNMRASNATGTTAFMLACRSNHLDVVKFLLSQNDSFDAIDNEGMNALFYAIDGKSVEIAKLLIETGIDTTVTTPYGISAKDYARNELQKEIFELFPEEIEEYHPPGEFLVYNRFADLVPGMGFNSDVPAYFPDVVNILRGMDCERFIPNFAKAGLSLEEFLTISDEKLKEIGIEFPFQRKMIKLGLFNFHIAHWTPESLYVPPHFKKDLGYMDLIMMFANIIRQMVVIKSQLIYISNLEKQFNLKGAFTNVSYKYVHELHSKTIKLEKGIQQIVDKTPKSRPLMIFNPDFSGRNIKFMVKLALITAAPILAFKMLRK